jgi:hypothetical protein
MNIEIVCVVVVIITIFVLIKIYTSGKSEGYNGVYLSPLPQNVSDPYWRYYGFGSRHL